MMILIYVFFKQLYKWWGPEYTTALWTTTFLDVTAEENVTACVHEITVYFL